MKATFLISLLIGQMGLLEAQDVVATKIEPPFDLSEGTEIELSKDKLRPYKSWLESTKLQLTLLQEGNQTLTRQERYAKLRRGVEKVLANADQSRNELFTRYILKRGIVIDNTLIEEEENLRILDARLSLLEDSISMALSKCESDLVYLNLEPSQQGDLDFVGFAIEYSSLLSTLAKTILDSGAQYKVYRSLLGFYQWDLYRDSNNKSEVANIYRINSALESIPEQVPSDSLKVLQKIREMKITYQLVSNSTVKQYNSKRQAANEANSSAKQASNANNSSIKQTAKIPVYDIFNAKDFVALTFGEGFQIQTTEVTQKQWVEVMGSNESFYSKAEYCDDFQIINGVSLCPSNPLESVPLDDFLGFIERLNSAQSRYTYRLPTFVEWMFVFTGSTSVTDYYKAPNIYITDPTKIDRSTWHKGNSTVGGSYQTHKVAQKEKNQYGLYDMLGNVWEWVDNNETPQLVGRGYADYANGKAHGARGVSTNFGDKDIGFRLVRISR